MGTQHKHGYSADVEGFLVIEGKRIRLAKTNGQTLVLAEMCELPPGIEGELLVIVDGFSDSKRVVVKDGILPGQTIVEYEVTAPF
jgi:hypothetical protein